MCKKIMKPLYIFFHIPKTGGTTLGANIKNNFSKDEILELYFDFFESGSMWPQFKKNEKSIDSIDSAKRSSLERVDPSLVVPVV